MVIDYHTTTMHCYILIMNAVRKAKKKKVMIANGISSSIEEMAKAKLFQLSCYCDDQANDQSEILNIEPTRPPYPHKSLRTDPSQNYNSANHHFILFDKEIFNILKTKPKSLRKITSLNHSINTSQSKRTKLGNGQCNTHQRCFINTIQSNEVFVASKFSNHIYQTTPSGISLSKINPTYKNIKQRSQTQPSQHHDYNPNKTTTNMSQNTYFPPGYPNHRHSLSHNNGRHIQTPHYQYNYHYNLANKQQCDRLKQRIKKQLFHSAMKERLKSIMG